jgi:hypothetical protein
LQSVLIEYIQGFIGDNPQQLRDFYSVLALLCEFTLKDVNTLITISSSIGIHRKLSQYSHHVYALLLGREEGLVHANVRAEIEWWMHTGIYEYVDIYDRAMSIALSRENARETFPSIVITNGSPCIPPHLFGELVKANSSFLIPYLPSLIELCNSGIYERRAAFFALAHFVSVPQTTEYVVQIVEIIVTSTLNTKSYVLRGTLLCALSMIYVSPFLTTALQQTGFTLFRFGQNSCVIPIDITTLLISFEQNGIQIPAVFQSPSKYCNYASQLLNPIQRGTATTELLTASKENQTELRTSENAYFVHRLLALNCFQLDSRQLLSTIFHGIPLVKQDFTSVDPQLEAECRARLFEAQLLSGNLVEAANYVFSTIPIPNLTVTEIQNSRKGSLAPEVYLSNADFKALTRYDRTAFYQLPEEQRNTILAAHFK